MVRARRMTIMLTPDEASLVWGLLDGQMDAGACEGGLSKAEHDACGKVCDALIRHSQKEPRHD